jgi:hypothetical protein
LRVRVAAILAAHFPEWHVEPGDIRPATGRWRTDWKLDVYRWELYACRRHPDGTPNRNMPVVAGCWETLTEFARLAGKYGCECSGGTLYPRES